MVMTEKFEQLLNSPPKNIYELVCALNKLNDEEIDDLIESLILLT